MEEHPNDSPVADLRRIDRADEQPAGRGRSRARFLTELVTAASMLPAGGSRQSEILCRRRPDRRRCGGRIEIARDPESDAIHWRCVLCGDAGVITNWQDTRWDLSAAVSAGRVVSLSAERERRRSRATASALPARVYELEVELVGAPLELEERVLRRFRITGTATLQDLHHALACAFDRDETDAPFEFMFGAPYDPAMRSFSGVSRPEPEPREGTVVWETQSTRLDALELREGDAFGYLYDFASEWVHRITVVTLREVRDPPVLPLCIERQGASPRLPRSVPSAEDAVSFPLSRLYGPYQAGTGPSPDGWLSLDELERQLLVLEAHLRALPPGHPPLAAPLLHAVLHSLAETDLAVRGALCSQGEPDRHAFIHRLGESLVRRLLDAGVAEWNPGEPSR
jgi:hypothetical protein